MGGAAILEPARFLLALVLCVYTGASGRALAVGATLLEMDHKSWTARDGAPQGITALALAADGVMWIGSEGGLFSFDGHTFTAFKPALGEPDLPMDAVRTLIATRDGAIWVGFHHDGMARVSPSHVKLFTRADQLRLSYVDHICQASDGSLWALHRQTDLIRLGADGVWHVEPTPLGNPGGAIVNFFIDSSDTLWLGQGGRLYRRPVNQPKYFATEAEADWLFGFAETPDHSLWVNDSITDAPGHPAGRTQRIEPSGKVLAHLPYTNNLYGILYAPDGSLILLPTGEGLLRFSAAALAEPALLQREIRDDAYTQKDGLSSNQLRAMLLDADGNLWAGGQRGLDRLRQARLVPFIMKYGDTSAYLCAGKSGDVWIASGGTRIQLYKISGESTTSFPSVGQVYAMTCTGDGDTLLVSNKGISNIHANRIHSIPTIPGTHAFDTLQIVATPDHKLLASVSGTPSVNGIWRYDRSWTKLTGAKILSSAPAVEFVDSEGRLLTAYADGQIARPLEQGGQLLSLPNPGIGAVQAFLETSHGLLAAGINGLAVLRNNRVEVLDFADRASSRGVGGLVESDSGDLWLNTLHGVVHIPSAELQTALQTTHYRMKSELLTEGDFVGPIELWPGRSRTARDAEGKLWFATMNGVFHIDTRHLDRRSHPPNLSIRSTTADQKPVGSGGNIGRGSSTLEIHYLGVNLTMPDSVTYKYRLDGLDDAWRDVGRRTEAIYTQLRPGRYTFRVIASNGDGAWTQPVSSASFEVLPRYYQKTWFWAVLVSVVLALILTLYRLRLHQVRARHEALNKARLEMAHVTRLATLSAMTASIAHEVSQPISGILTNSNTCARMLAADPPNISGAAETVRRTVRDANRASEVVKRLRAMFANKAPTLELVDLNDAAREVIAMSAAELRQSGSLLQTEFTEPLPPIRGDRVQIQQVILNLLLNAADAMANIDDRPRSLWLQTLMHGSDSVKLLVRDCGVGLDPRGTDKLFEAFYTTKAHGLGIGLAVSRSIIESHKGRLWATANDGPGATFCLSLPCESEAGD